ncbi:MAG: S8 family serine peptidase [Acidobacteriaceae bacterium]|nr:S8 family serine peptidase [Acidobacteriaceae bacterium]
MANIVLTIPNTEAGRIALSHLKGNGASVFGGAYEQSLSDRLRGTRAAEEIEGSKETFHLYHVPDCGEWQSIAAILRFHSYPEGRPPSHGHVSGAEIDTEFTLSGALGTPITFDPKNRASYRAILNADVALQDGIRGANVNVAVVDSGADVVSLQDFYDVQDTVNIHPGAQMAVDLNGHGTAMVEIVKDIAPSSSIYAVRIAQHDKARLWDAMAGTALAVVDCKADIVNLSLGFPDFGVSPCPWCGSQAHVRSVAFEKLLLSLAANQPKGAIYVAATGNGWISSGFEFPAGYLDTLAVGSVTVTQRRSSFSNYGTANHPRYVMAPGGEIDQNSKKITEPVGAGSIASFAGTSAAAAYASGVLALLKSQKRYQAVDRNQFIAAVLQNHCTPPAQTTSIEYGSGIIHYDSPPSAGIDSFDISTGKAMLLGPVFKLKKQFSQLFSNF